MNKILTAIIFISLTFSLFAQKPEGPFLKLDGDGDFMQLSAWADSLIFDGPATIEFWARADFDHRFDIGMIWAINDGNPIAGDNAESFELRYGSNTSGITNELLTIFYSLWSTNAYGTRNDATVEGQWHHFTFVCGNNDYTVYIDGQDQELLASSSVANDIPKGYGSGFIPKQNVPVGWMVLLL